MVKRLWNKNYILLLQGSAVSTLGDLMYSVAIGFWVYEQTGSSGLMGLMTSISMFVTMFLSPFSGSVIDKLNRKWVLVIGDLFQGSLMLTVGILAFTDNLSVPVVLLAAFLASLGGVFYSPAASTSLIDIIPRDDMVRGQSLFSGVQNIINLIGSAFSGVMVVFFGVPLIIIINGISNIYAAISELFISIPKSAQEGERVSVKSVLRDSKTAVTEIFSNPHLKLFIPCLLIINLLSAGPFSLIIPFVKEKGFADEQYGYLITVWALASIVSSVLVGTLKLSAKSRYWSMSIGFILSVVFSIFTYLSTDFVPMCVLAFFAGFFNAAGNAIFNASLILALPEKNRGAIMGFISSASVGGTALSSVIYGIMGDIFPLYIVFVVGTVISLIPLFYLCFNKRTKEFILAN